MKKQQNRFWMVLNYLSLIVGMLLYYAVKIYNLPGYLIYYEIGFMAIFLFSLFKAFVKTKYWRIVHTSSKKLDEREMQVVLNAMKYAYGIFTIVCLVVIYSFAIAENQPIDILLAGALLYFAHTLPAAIVGWNERNISIDDD